MELRWYQEEAVEAIYQHLRTRKDNPCAVLPTGGGKTPVLAKICSDATEAWGGRVLVLAHVKELLEQAQGSLQHFLDDPGKVGLYSAGLKSRDTEHPIIIAGIQSVYKRACELGAFNIIIVDEAHLIPTNGDGMYRQFLADAKMVNPDVKIIGLTATPFRLDSGLICGSDHILNSVCYEAGVKELIIQNYLCPLRSKAGLEKPDLSNVHKRGGEYIASEMAEAMDPVVESAVQEIMAYAQDRHSVLIFASSVKHAETIKELLEQAGQVAEIVTGESSSDHRAKCLEDFKAQRLKYLVNVNVLTTGFDAPNVDCIALVRATASPGLYYQMVGRGLRIHESKHDCLVLDFGNNIVTHGPVDDIQPSAGPKGDGTGAAPMKECPECHEMVYISFSTCPACNYVWPEDEIPLNHTPTASEAGILSGEVVTLNKKVNDTYYCVHTKRGKENDPDYPRTLRVDYSTGVISDDRVSEWVCLEHAPGSFARRKAEIWWKERSKAPVPCVIEDAVELANNGALAETTEITVRCVTGERYDTIIGYEIEGVPEWEGVEEPEEAFAGTGNWWGDDDDVPF